MQNKTPENKVVNKSNMIQDNLAHIDQASFLLRSLHNPIRQQIISILLAKERCAVKELCEEMDVKQSIMSQNLALLRNAGIVIPRRTGKLVYYSINQEHFSEIIKFVQNLSRVAQ
ncbi:MAG TPA: metalloregulator ArsR/SmtB family transcription factor [Chitinophagales bacterium]|nr:metalloregulator ArsR/SmtB family transcription factor [Chitinophagales bacterium]